MSSYLNEVKQLLKLAFPLFLTQITGSLMFFTDTIMASQVSHVDMAAVSISVGIWGPALFALQGLLMAVTPIVGNIMGAKQHSTNKKLASVLIQSSYLSLLLGGLLYLVFQFVPHILGALSLQPTLYEQSLLYLQFISWGIIPTALFFAIRGFCEGIALTRPALIISIVMLIVNIPLNYLFVFGEFGFTALGGAGCGLATASVQWIGLVCFVGYVFYAKPLKAYLTHIRLESIDWKRQFEIIKVGTPISMALLFESTLFAFIALFIAPLGSIAVAGHQIAFSYTSVLFMLPLSLGLAATIRVGLLNGQNNLPALKQAVICTFSLAVGFSLLTAVCTILFRSQIISIYTDQPEVTALASIVLIYAALYQLPDALQVVSAGVLKGLKQTKALFYITLVSYWPIGLGVGYVLGRTQLISPPWGVEGFWMGIVLGLSSAAGLYIIWLIRLFKSMSKAC